MFEYSPKRVIMLSDDLSKEISYVFYRARKIHHMITDLITVASFKRRPEISRISTRIDIKDYIKMIKDDEQDLNKYIQRLTDTNDKLTKMNEFQSGYLQQDLNSFSNAQFLEFYDRAYQLVLECDIGFGSDIDQLLTMNTEVLGLLYKSRFDHQIKSEITDLIDTARYPIAFIENSILNPLKSLELTNHSEFI